MYELIMAALTIGVVVWLVTHVQNTQSTSTATRLGVALCWIGLVVIVGSSIAPITMFYWVAHPVLAVLLSASLLIGILYPTHVRRAERRQVLLAHGPSGAALAELVDPLIDVEVAVSLAGQSSSPSELEPERWASWDKGGEPLAWLRDGRDLLGTDRDPRLHSGGIPQDPGPWALPLIDQSLARLTIAIRDWGHLLQTSDAGVAVMATLSEARAALADTSARLGHEGRLTEREQDALVNMRRRLRVLTLCLAQWNGERTRPPYVLDSHAPLPSVAPSFAGSDALLKVRLSQAAKSLGMERAT